MLADVDSCVLCFVIAAVSRDVAIQWSLKNAFELVELSSHVSDSDGSDEGLLLKSSFTFVSNRIYVCSVTIYNFVDYQDHLHCHSTVLVSLSYTVTVSKYEGIFLSGAVKNSML